MDPQSTTSHDVLDAFMHPAQSFEQHQEAALGWSVEPGTWIQFFTTSSDQEEIQRVTSSSFEGKAEPLAYTTVFGAAPSANDRTISQLEANHSGDGQVGNIIPKPGHFGAVSEAGFSICRRERLENGQCPEYPSRMEDTEILQAAVHQEASNTFSGTEHDCSRDTRITVDMPFASLIEVGGGL